jgi:prepilin-type processing-associated H-X9-DG protein
MGLTMSDEELIGFLFDALDHAERSAVEECLQVTPEAVTRLEQLRLAFLPLESDRDPGPPPVGLAQRTLNRISAVIAELDVRSDPLSDASSSAKLFCGEPPQSHLRSDQVTTPVPSLSLPRAPREEPESRTMGGRFRPDLIIACGIAFFAFGLVFSAIGKIRAHYQLMSCQANLQTLHAGLVGYADTHDGYYPQVGPKETTESFATALVNAGQVPNGFRLACPASASDDTSTPVRYTYSLGFQAPSGELNGLRRPSDSCDEHDLLPISADYPTASAAPADGPLCEHPPLMNVLFLGGHVRSTTSPLIGPNGDDIYRNVFGKVAAGANRMDVVLGRPGDTP